MIDNYSRRILAWKIATSLTPGGTCDVLREAAHSQTVVIDSGVENINHEVSALEADGFIRRILALVEVDYSNSMIEAFWRSLRHQWLYINTLDSEAALNRLVAFYVEQHNGVLPHSAFRGQTPDEVYFGTAPNLFDELATARYKARHKRIQANRDLACKDCSVKAA